MIVGVTYLQGYIGCALLYLPRTCSCTCYGTITLEFDIGRLSYLFLGMIQLVAMNQQLVLTRNTVGSYLLCSGYIGTRHLLASIFEGSSHQPSVLALEHLVDTHLMSLTPVLETGVINQIRTTVFSGDDGVMTLRPLAKVSSCRASPRGISTEDVDTAVVIVLLRTEVQQIRGEYSTVVTRIGIGTVGILRAKHTHLVTTVVIVVGHTTGSQSAIGNKQVVIPTDILNIAGLARYIVSTCNLLTEVRIDGNTVARASQGIFYIIVAQSCILIEFQHPDTTAP